MKFPVLYPHWREIEAQEPEQAERMLRNLLRYEGVSELATDMAQELRKLHTTGPAFVRDGVCFNVYSKVADKHDKLSAGLASNVVYTTLYLAFRTLGYRSVEWPLGHHSNSQGTRLALWEDQEGEKRRELAREAEALLRRLLLDVELP